MASIGHVAVGMAAARVCGHRDSRPPLASIAAWSALSLLPDADVVGFSFGVRYADEWGHRGATHSLLFTAALGVAFGLATAAAFRRPRADNVLLATAVAMSHPLLDTLTDGGLGCALFWPFALTRYFAPWRPIPAAPIGLFFFSPYGLKVSLVELVLFAPLFVFALWRRPIPAAAAGALLSTWGALTWLMTSADPVRERIVGLVLREDTRFASGYSEDAFRAIAIGESDASVRHRLGPPYAEEWAFVAPDDSTPAWDRAAPASGCFHVRIESNLVVAAHHPGDCRAKRIATGAAAAEAANRLGSPSDACWEYSWSPTQSHFRQRVVCFSRSRVVEISRRWE